MMDVSMLGYVLVGGIAVLTSWWCWWSTPGAKKICTREILEKKLGAQRTQQVRNGVLTAIQVADSTGWPLQTVEGPVQRLRTAGKAAELIEKVRAMKYDSGNAAHEALLERLWAALKPGVQRTARKTDEWGELGFQGKDPATDFRGNGLLGLANLVYFAEQHGELARRMMKEGGWAADKGMTWYLLAVTGINLTTTLNTMLKTGSLDRHFESAPVAEPLTSDPTEHPVVVIHSQLYSTILSNYHELWTKHKPSVMEFNSFMDVHVKPSVAPEKLEKLTS
ncbi:ELMO domain-containing protein B [Diplonema papillatum]|nr:ELMO domain-containing protein B [Diplonema papillatum]|eukprot:gene8248-12731_t